MKAPTLCSTPNCKNTTYSGKCEGCRKSGRRRREAGRATRTARGYNRKWLRTQGAFLKVHKTCECDTCKDLPESQRPKAEHAHHRDGLGPDGPNGHKWWNLQALTEGHHSKVTAKMQPGGWNR